MTDISLLEEIGNDSADFQYNTTIPKDWETQPLIKVFLFASENEIKIRLASCIIDTHRVVCSFIENNQDISRHASQGDDAVLIRNLPLCADKPVWILAPKPMTPCKELFFHGENSFDIVFKDCAEYVAENVFDRLTNVLSSFTDCLAGNAILDGIKSLVSAVNPIFRTVNVTRFLGYRPLVFDEYAVYQLSDIFRIEFWDIGLSAAKGLYDAIDRQLQALVVPSEAIEDLNIVGGDRNRYIVGNIFSKSGKKFEAMGLAWGCSCERVHQIVSKAEQKFRASSNNMNLGKTIFNSLKMLSSSEYCLTISELEKYSVSEGWLKFLSKVLGNQYSLTDIPDTDYIAFADQDGKCEWPEYIINISKSLPALLLPGEPRSIVEAISSSLIELGYEIPETIQS